MGGTHIYKYGGGDENVGDNNDCHYDDDKTVSSLIVVATPNKVLDSEYTMF